MFRTEKPWLAVYEGRVEPETEVFEGSLYDLFRRSVEEHLGKTALTFYGTEFAFERLHALVEKTAAPLAAFVVKREGSAVTEEQIIAFREERLAAYRATKSVEFRDFLPKFTVGKLLRRVLTDEERERAGLGTQSATGAPPPPSPS